MTRKTRSRPCHQGQNLIASALMKLRLFSAGIACCASSIALPAVAQAMPQTLSYVENGHARHVLDIYAPTGAKNLPVVFWIHGGGWQTGDKANVQE